MNTLGNTARGPSNTIASPGVSGIFGGGSITERATTARPQAAQIHTPNFSGKTPRDELHRYSNTFRSAAFGHA